MDISLVIMAAGMGSRYGGNKQIDGIGPSGEILMEYSIYDAVRTGFNKVVFIIKPDMEPMMRELFGNKLETRTAKDGKPVQVRYVVQDFSSVPDFYQIPVERTKPFGTVHALLCAKSAVNEPFCVINADDYYGIDAYASIYQELTTLPTQGKATMVGYQLRNTASANGTVNRGVCRVENGQLQSVHETMNIQLNEDGGLTALDEGKTLAPDVPVSMNFWGFAPSIFAELKTYFTAFLKSLPTDALKAECLLPVMVDELMKRGELTVSVLHSDAQWFGMTYKADKQIVADALRKLHEDGTYPKSLRD